MSDSPILNTISTPFGSLHYAKYGSGPKTLLVFHGFGQDHTMVIPLLEVFQDDYSIFSFDMPYHGKSQWSDTEQPITKEAIREIFNDWLKANGINDFSVLGYSMGGKFALTLAEQFVDQIEHCILIAPDGLYKSPWYRLATSFPIKILFRHIVNQPGFFNGLVWTITKTRMVSSKLIKFATSQMSTIKQRKQVYYTWINFKNLFISKQKLLELVKKQNLKLILILGEKDSVIKPKFITPFVENNDKVDVFILPTGHGRLVNESLQTLTDQIKKWNE